MNKLGFYMGTFFVLIFITLPNIAVASSSSSDLLGELSDSEGPESLTTNVIGDIIWVFVALGIVIALLILAIKWLSKRNKVLGGPKGIRSLGGISLGQQASLQVIELGGRIYIIGVGDQVTLIDKEEDPNKVAQLIDELEQNAQLNLGFTSLRDWLATKKKSNVDQQQPTTSEQGMWNQSNSFEDMLQSKLDKQTERKQELESLLKDNNK